MGVVWIFLDEVAVVGVIEVYADLYQRSNPAYFLEKKFDGTPSITDPVEMYLGNKGFVCHVQRFPGAKH